MLIPEEWHASGFDVVYPETRTPPQAQAVAASLFITPGGPSRPWQLIRFRCVSRGLLALVSLIHT